MCAPAGDPMNAANGLLSMIYWCKKNANGVGSFEVAEKDIDVRTLIFLFEIINLTLVLATRKPQVLTYLPHKTFFLSNRETKKESSRKESARN